MNIVILGAGAIGSLFGGLLSKNNNVLLIGRTSHVKAIRKNGLKITGKTSMKVKIRAEDSVNSVTFSPDLLILTVKSYDTENAIQEAKVLLNEKTVVLSLQNGLDNIDKIKKIVNHSNIMGGVTTHGAVLSQPGVIQHTGKGQTILGELNRQKTERLEHIVSAFNEVGIETKSSLNLMKEIWVKAIINSSINPLTTFFDCKNGYLLENPVLENIVGKVCKESTAVAEAIGIHVSYLELLKRTKEVIFNTTDNYSSMLQSFRKGRKTEIDSINGKIVDIGKKHDIDAPINEILIYLIKSTAVKK